MRNDFVCFILTHGRADNVITYKSLKKAGYTGKVVFVVDNEDEQIDLYKKNFGEENVYVFDKKAVSQTFDTFDNSDNRKTIVYARNACFDIAKELGYRYFLELDDDYTVFQIRKVKDGKFKGFNIKNIDRVFEAYIDWLNVSGAVTVAMAQGGDFVGGKDAGNVKKGVLRKAMNTFFCDVEKPFKFVGRINEDVNTYTMLGQQGKLFLTAVDFAITQVTTQKSNGGMTDVYLDNGTYVKSFFTVICSPSCCDIRYMGAKHKRLHHHIKWDKCTPMILNEKHKKRSEENGE